jgi:cupin fold WbuC family metalloprotein
MSSVRFINKDIIEIGKTDLDILKSEAQRSPLRRARICLHKNYDEQVHEMIIAFCFDSYVIPHRHVNKIESFHIIDGKLAIIFFDEIGEVINKIIMAPLGSGFTFLYRLSSPLWHTVIPITEYVIIHETTAGPFIQGEAERPKWAPDENEHESVKRFVEKMRQAAIY